MSHRTPAQTGLAVLDLAQAGRFAEIAELFAPPLRAMVPPEALQAAWAAELSQRGPVSQVGTPGTEPVPGGAVVTIPVTFTRGETTVVVTVSDDGWLGGIQLKPAGQQEQPDRPWQPPPYADPGSFGEQEVTLGTGPLAVPGTLSLPRRGGPLPGVVLLGGSGPVDRDETIGSNKPFKDLAWGLASRGVAVLRFDKVTHAHGGEVSKNPAFTLTDEYVPAAVAAVGLLGQQPAVDRIFLAGHSLGGSVAPRVAVAGPPVAGLVILAGGAEPLHWSMVRQFRYLAALDPSPLAAPEPVLAAVTRQAELVDSPGLSPATPAADLPFAVPAPYWLDLRGYDPPAAAAALGKPVLLLQGGRDYQATVAGDLTRWRAGLAGRPDVTIRVYEADNHLFFPGSGPSAPAEYEPPQHLDPAVVADIVSWLASPAADGPGRDR
jgi:dienelactone hydrolase